MSRDTKHLLVPLRFLPKTPKIANVVSIPEFIALHLHAPNQFILHGRTHIVVTIWVKSAIIP